MSLQYGTEDNLLARDSFGFGQFVESALQVCVSSNSECPVKNDTELVSQLNNLRRTCFFPQCEKRLTTAIPRCPTTRMCYN